jgi:hypothetical protein
MVNAVHRSNTAWIPLDKSRSFSSVKVLFFLDACPPDDKSAAFASAAELKPPDETLFSSLLFKTRPERKRVPLRPPTTTLVSSIRISSSFVLNLSLFSYSQISCIYYNTNEEIEMKSLPKTSLFSPSL